MSNNDAILTEYVPKELFDIHIQNIREKASSDEKLTEARISSLERLLDERFNRLQAVVEKNLAEFKAENSEMRGDLKVTHSETRAEISEIRGEVKTLGERIEHAIDTLSVAISNNNQRLDDFKEELEQKQTVSATRIGIFTALFIGAVQVIVSLVLHFWF